MQTNTSKQNNNAILVLWPKPKDYWKIAAADFVSSFAGFWGGPGVAVGAAIIGSINKAL